MSSSVLLLLLLLVGCLSSAINSHLGNSSFASKRFSAYFKTSGTPLFVLFNFFFILLYSLYYCPKGDVFFLWTIWRHPLFHFYSFGWFFFFFFLLNRCNYSLIISSPTQRQIFFYVRFLIVFFFIRWAADGLCVFTCFAVGKMWSPFPIIILFFFY